MLQQLTGQLAPMLSAAAAASSAAASLAGGAGSASGRRLREVGEQPRSADRLKALAARFQGLRDSRIALRDWLAAERANRSTKGSPASSGTSGTSGSQRRLRQEDGAREAAPPLLVEGAPSDQSFRGEELPPLLLVLEGDEAGDMPLWQDGYLIIEVGWVQSSKCALACLLTGLPCCSAALSAPLLSGRNRNAWIGVPCLCSGMQPPSCPLTPFPLRLRCPRHADAGKQPATCSGPGHVF
jgi:hypothetical protein